jgi:hypothetical protein
LYLVVLATRQAKAITLTPNLQFILKCFSRPWKLYNILYRPCADSRASVNLGVKVFGLRSATTLKCAGLVDSVRFTYTMMCETLDPQLFRSGYPNETTQKNSSGVNIDRHVRLA